MCFSDQRSVGVNQIANMFGLIRPWSCAGDTARCKALVSLAVIV